MIKKHVLGTFQGRLDWILSDTPEIYGISSETNKKLIIPSLLIIIFVNNANEEIKNVILSNFMLQSSKISRERIGGKIRFKSDFLEPPKEKIGRSRWNFDLIDAISMIKNLNKPIKSLILQTFTNQFFKVIQLYMHWKFWTSIAPPDFLNLFENSARIKRARPRRFWPWRV